VGFGRVTNKILVLKPGFGRIMDKVLVSEKWASEESWKMSMAYYSQLKVLYHSHLPPLCQYQHCITFS
jgi:hypothetical protein